MRDGPVIGRPAAIHLPRCGVYRMAPMASRRSVAVIERFKRLPQYLAGESCIASDRGDPPTRKEQRHDNHGERKKADSSRIGRASGRDGGCRLRVLLVLHHGLLDVGNSDARNLGDICSGLHSEGRVHGVGQAARQHG